jgi:hypothetical protein
MLSFCLGDHQQVLKVNVCKKCNFFEIKKGDSLSSLLKSDIKGKVKSIDALLVNNNFQSNESFGLFHCWGVAIQKPEDFIWDSISFKYLGWV